jgi:Plasmid pRiA4b ORF-3-like protein
MTKRARETPQQIVHLQITLDDVTPKVMRLLAVPFGIYLDGLHLVFQAAMGWTNSHLYMIQARDVSWGEPDPDFAGDDLLPASRHTLADLVADTHSKTFKYVYDFGDDWRHTVKIEMPTMAVPGVAYPILIAASGRCPPEDIGGPFGYQEFIAALRDPAHDRHAEFLNWHGPEFDPSAVDTATLEQAVAALAHRMSRKRTRKATSRKA